MFTLIFIVAFAVHTDNGIQTRNSVLTQTGFVSLDACNAAGREMIERNAQYNKENTKVEWVCK